MVLHYKAHMKAYEVLSALRARLERQEGQALVEYALILALIAVVSIAILQSLGLNVKRVFTSVDSSLSSVVPEQPPKGKHDSSSNRSRSCLRGADEQARASGRS